MIIAALLIHSHFSLQLQLVNAILLPGTVDAARALFQQALHLVVSFFTDFFTVTFTVHATGWRMLRSIVHQEIPWHLGGM